MTDNEEKNNKARQSETMRAIANFSQIGFTIAANILVGVLLGKYLDMFFNSDPWLLIIFSLLGVISAIRSLFAMANNKR